MSDTITNLSQLHDRNNLLLSHQETTNQNIMSAPLVRISESLELPLTIGTIQVDTSKGGVTIFMKSVPAHSEKEFLIITKISHDNNMVSLFSETSLINNAEIIMFGLPIYAKVKKGKVKTIVLKSDGINWRIIREE